MTDGIPDLWVTENGSTIKWGKKTGSAETDGSGFRQLMFQD